MSSPSLIRVLRPTHHPPLIFPLLSFHPHPSIKRSVSLHPKSYLSSSREPPPPNYPRRDDGTADFRKWKVKEAEILRDILPITYLTKEILHSGRYMDGERLTVEDVKAVVERLLAYHPRSEDKIGAGLDYIMVDRHNQYKYTRCLFVVRTDGTWEDFSYFKCIGAYIQDKYPSYADRCIRQRIEQEGKRFRNEQDLV